MVVGDEIFVELAFVLASEKFEVDAAEGNNTTRLRKGIYGYVTSLPYANLEQKEDLFSAVMYKLVEIGIHDATTFTKSV